MVQYDPLFICWTNLNQVIEIPTSANESDWSDREVWRLVVCMHSPFRGAPPLEK